MQNLPSTLPIKMKLFNAATTCPTNVNKILYNMLKITEPPLPTPLHHKVWSFDYSKIRLEQHPPTLQTAPPAPE